MFLLSRLRPVPLMVLAKICVRLLMVWMFWSLLVFCRLMLMLLRLWFTWVRVLLRLLISVVLLRIVTLRLRAVILELLRLLMCRLRPLRLLICASVFAVVRRSVIKMMSSCLV